MSLAKQETEVALPRNVTGLVNFQEGPYSTESFDDSGGGIGGKYLRIGQKLSDAVETSDSNSWLGMFYLAGQDDEDEDPFDAPLEQITIVPLGGAAKRQLWVREGSEGKVQCSAIGRSFAELIGEGFPGGPCKDCKESKWVTDEKGKRSVNCDRVYSYVIYVVEWSAVCVWDLARTASPVGREVHKWLVNRGGGSAHGGFTNCAITLSAGETIGADYDNSSGVSIILLDSARPTAPAPTPKGQKPQPKKRTWYVPEAWLLPGTLEENDIYLPVDVEEGESEEEEDDKLPF